MRWRGWLWLSHMGLVELMNEVQWFYKEEEKVVGPHSEAELVALHRTGKIDNFTYLHDSESQKWGTFNDKIDLPQSFHADHETDQPLEQVEDVISDMSKTLWQKFHEWNETKSLPDDSFWKKGSYWVAAMVLFAAVKIYQKYYQ